MKALLLLMLTVLSFTAHAGFLFHYGLNYSSQKDDTTGGDFEQQRTFHKLYLGASVNNNRTLYFGWNINSWSSTIQQGTAPENKYSLLEMGPKLVWFMNEEFNWYLSGEWNPYARGDRERAAIKRDISGSSLAVGLGYRFRLSRMLGLGASIHYHNLSIDEEKIASSESNVSDSLTNIMPMLEFSLITK